MVEESVIEISMVGDDGHRSVLNSLNCEAAIWWSLGERPVNVHCSGARHE